MPLFYSHTIDDNTRLAIWQIEETADFFQEKVPLSREITHPHKRLQHLAGRYILQDLFPDFPIHLIQIASTRKPFLPDETHHFSISHCGGFAAAIVSTTRRVGIDIEQVSPTVARIQHKFLNAFETEQWATGSPDLPQPSGHLVTLIWSVKESLFKWYSLGEVDFQEHLLVQDIEFADDRSGLVHASFAKGTPQPVTLTFRFWNGLVLSYTSG